MKRFQWDELIADERKKLPSNQNTNYYSYTRYFELTSPIKVHYSFRGKSKIVDLIKVNGDNAYIVAEGIDKNTNFTRIELLDENGNVKIAPVTDMTGRVITDDSWVAYSRKEYTTHALEVGKVVRITPVGGVVVQSCLHNGRKVSKQEWNGGRLPTYTISDPDRSLKLPVDASSLMMWILGDFDNLAEFGDFGE